MNSPNGTVADVTADYKSYHTVVAATAISVEATRIPISFAPGNTYLAKGAVTTFKVIKSWKGKAKNIFRTKIIIECCVCGISFMIGKDYLLYLSKPDSDEYYSTSSCSRSRLLEQARDDEKILNGILLKKQ